MKVVTDRIRAFGSACVAVCMLLAAGCSKDEEAAGPEYPETREVVYSFHLQNNAGREIPSANIGLYLPMARSSNQNLLDFKISGTLEADYRHLEDEAGNSSVFYELKDLPADFTKTVKLQARIGFAATPHPAAAPDQRYLEVSAEDSAALGTMANIGFSAEDAVQAKLLKIAAALTPVAGDQNTADAGCIARLTQFTRLARLNQIAVRPVIGFRAPAAVDGHKPQYIPHCWAEYYDQDRWHAMDVMDAVPVADIKEYLAVRSFYSLRDLQQQTPAGLMAEGYGLSISLIP